MVWYLVYAIVSTDSEDKSNKTADREAGRKLYIQSCIPKCVSELGEEKKIDTDLLHILLKYTTTHI